MDVKRRSCEWVVGGEEGPQNLSGVVARSVV